MKRVPRYCRNSDSVDDGILALRACELRFPSSLGSDNHRFKEIIALRRSDLDYFIYG